MDTLFQLAQPRTTWGVRNQGHRVRVGWSRVSGLKMLVQGGQARAEP